MTIPTLSVVLGCGPVAEALQGKGGADAGGLELHCGAILKRALSIDLLQHAHDVGSYGLGLINGRLSSDINFADILWDQGRTAASDPGENGSHGGCILVSIRNRHALNADSFNQLAGIDAPIKGELS